MNIAFLAAALLAQPAQATPPAQTEQAAPAAAATQDAPAGQAGAAPGMPRPSPEVMTAMRSWGDCLDGAVSAVPATETPEAAAPRVIAQCQTQQQQMTSLAETWITGLTVGADQQAEMRRRLATVSTGLEQRVADRIRQTRGRPVGR